MRFPFPIIAALATVGAFIASPKAALSAETGGGTLSGTFTRALGDAYPYRISAITTDSAGNTYAVGSRLFFGASPAGASVAHSSDIFVSKIDFTGGLAFTAVFGGEGTDAATAIALDPKGGIYIAGSTTSRKFPLVNPLSAQFNSSGTGFIIKLTNDGSHVLYSTYFGGALGETGISSLATDAKGNLFLTGTTRAPDFPHTDGMPFGPTTIQMSNSGVILSCISAMGDKILYSGALTGGPIPQPGSGALATSGVGVAVDADGNAYFSGNVGQGDLPTTSGVFAPNASFTGFLAKVDTEGGTLAYLTYLPTLNSALTVDPAGNAYIAGLNHQAINGPDLIYIAKVDPSAGALLWRNDLENAQGAIRSIALDRNGDVWAAGGAELASTFSNSNGWTTGEDFLIRLNSVGDRITYSALFPYGSTGQSVAIDPAGLVHVAGADGFVSTISPSIGSTGNIFALQNAFGESVTARVSPGEVIAIYGSGIGPATPSTSQPLNGFYPDTLAGVQVSINGVNMPLLYVSANQINAVVPLVISAGAAATIHVSNGTLRSADYSVWVVSSDPHAFPAVLNQDGTVNSETNPARSGSIVTLYATGWQSNFSPLIDGQIATEARDFCAGSCFSSPASTVTYGGAAPGIVAGVSQLNVRIDPVSPGPPFQMSLDITGASASLMQGVWVVR